MSVQRELDVPRPPRAQAPSLSQEHQSRSTHKGGTSSYLYLVHPGLRVSLLSPHVPPVLGAEAAETSVTHSALGCPACPQSCGSYPNVPSFPSGPQVGGIHRAVASLWTRGVGEGPAQAGQRVWTREGHSARPETVAPCPGLPQAHSGLLFPDSSSWGKSQYHLYSADPPGAGRNHSPGESLTAQGHAASESLWQHSWLPPRAQPHPKTPKGACGGKERSADEAHASSGDPAHRQGGAQNSTAPQGAAPQVLQGAQDNGGQDFR